MQTAPERPTKPTASQIIEKTQQVFQKRPCHLQVKICQAILEKNKNILCMAATGFGKTLTFFMPLLSSADGIIIIVTALNILGKQIVGQLAEVNISAIAISAETYYANMFLEIKSGLYRAIVANPEILLQTEGLFDKLWLEKGFVSKVITIIFDEAHCVTRWGSFRPEYRDLGRLRHFLPATPFFAASATLSPRVIRDVSDILRFRKDNTKKFIRSNDRPNVFLSVRAMQHPLKSYKDLAFLVPKGKEIKPPKFLVFFDNIKECERACKYVRSRLPLDSRHLIKWYHATMSEPFRIEELEAFINGDRWGLFVTDSFGMGVDVSNIQLIVQWRASCSMDTLVQRFGRGARNPDLEAYALLLAEPHWFDAERERMQEAREKRQNRKRGPNGAECEPPPKRAAVSDGGNAIQPRPIPVSLPGEEEEDGDDIEDAEESDSDSESIIDEDRGEETDSEVPDTVAVSNTDEERRRRYDEFEGATGKRSAKSQKEIDPAMDDYVNARTREGLGEYTILYAPELDIADTPDLVGGCRRCAPRSSRLCCDGCHLREIEAFLSPFMIAAIENDTVVNANTASSRPKSRIKGYKAESKDRDLSKLLFAWRDRKAKEILSPALLIDYGPELFIPDDVIQRIVDCAHSEKLSTADNIARETQSRKAVSYSSEILDIVKSVRPSPLPASPFTTAPKRPALQTISLNGTATAKRAVRCSKCRQYGHNAKNASCPAKRPVNQ